MFKCSGASLTQVVTVNATTCGKGAAVADEGGTWAATCHADTSSDGSTVHAYKKNTHGCVDTPTSKPKNIEDSAVSATVAGFAATATAVAAAVLL
jgi:hypothetical protein